MKFGITSGFYIDLPWRQFFKRTREYDGLEHIEIYPYADLSSEVLMRENREIKKLAEDLGLNIDSLHWGDSFNVKQVDDFKPLLRNAEEGIELCRRIDIKYIVLHAGNPEHYTVPTGPYNMIVEATKEAAEIAKDSGVRIAFENVNLFFNSKKLVRLALDTDPDTVGICLDVGHANLLGFNVEREVMTAGRHLWTLHIHDNFGRISGIDLVPGENWMTHDLHLPPATGNINWTVFMKALKKIGYSGVMMFELSPKVGGQTGEIYLNLDERSMILLKAEKALENAVHTH